VFHALLGLLPRRLQGAAPEPDEGGMILLLAVASCVGGFAAGWLVRAREADLRRRDAVALIGMQNAVIHDLQRKLEEQRQPRYDDPADWWKQ
jgi:hypothetical protein